MGLEESEKELKYSQVILREFYTAPLFPSMHKYYVGFCAFINYKIVQ